MPIAVYFHPASMSVAQYRDIMERLDDAGVGTPPGRLHHSAFGPADHLMVYDVWDSKESFDTFTQTLMPILKKVGIDPGTPDVMPIHGLLQMLRSAPAE